MQLLQDWLKENMPNADMLWREPLLEQVAFVRDRISWLLSRTQKEREGLIQVVSSHISKSILCPVYYIYLERLGLQVWMRNNFYNWNVSIESGQPLPCSFLDCFDDSGNYLFCEGMEQWMFGRFTDDNRRFTVCISDHYDLWVFFRAIRKHLGIKRTGE